MIYAVAMSGGVDSSTVAALLKSQGHDVFGITMDIHSYCEDAIENARKVCELLKIPHYVVDLRNEFKRCVMDVFAEYYANGLTPNPCALCNRDIKLNLLLNAAKSMGADLMATGHYVRLIVDGDKVELSEARNSKKDQSYFLSLVDKNNLKYVRCPLGDIESKSMTRQLASDFGLPNFDKTDSQDICFIKHLSYKEFLHKFYPSLPFAHSGNIVLSETKQILGKHNGIENFTIGQRRGIGVPFHQPLFVKSINATSSEVEVSTTNIAVQHRFLVTSVNFIAESFMPFKALAKLRSCCVKIKVICQASMNGLLVDACSDHCTVPVTPGQICTLYSPDCVVVGGGIINRL